MKITFLGTGTSVGVPVPCCRCEVCQSVDPKDKRLRASVYVETDHGEAIIIDCGPDFRQQVLTYSIDRLSAILLTHLHYDHASAFDELRPFTYASPLPIYAESVVNDELKKKYDYILVNSYPGAPQINLIDIDSDQSFLIGKTEIIPIRLMHGQLPILGFRINDFAYLTDCTDIPKEEFRKLQGLNTLVIDALRHYPHPTHYSVDQALEIVSKLNPLTTYFTHMSDKIGLHKEVEKTLPANVHLGYDGLIFDT